MEQGANTAIGVFIFFSFLQLIGHCSGDGFRQQGNFTPQIYFFLARSLDMSFPFI